MTAQPPTEPTAEQGWGCNVDNPAPGHVEQAERALDAAGPFSAEPTAEPCVHGVFGPHWVGRDGDTPEWECRQPTAERAGDAEAFDCDVCGLNDHHDSIAHYPDVPARVSCIHMPNCSCARPAAVPDRDENLRAAIEALLADFDTWEGYETRDIGHAYLAESVQDLVTDIRAVLGDSGALAEHDAKALRARLAEHRGTAFTGDEIRCRCDGQWRTMPDWEAHVAADTGATT